MSKLVPKLALLSAVTLLAALVVTLLTIGAAGADVSAFDQYVGATTGNASVYGNHRTAEVFVPTQAHYISCVSVLLAKQGTVLNSRIGVKATSGGLPTGNWLSYADISGDNALGNGTIGSELTWYTFQLSKELHVDEDTAYAIQLEYTSGDASNCLLWAYGNDTYTNGNRTYTDNGVNWSVDAGNNSAFIVWGEPDLEIYSAEVYTGYKETNDWLVVVHYTNQSSPYYNVPGLIQRYFRLQLVDSSDTVIADNVPRFWGMGVGSIYISSDDASILEWGGNYTVKLAATYSNSSATYSLGDNQWRGQNLNELDSWCLSVARQMETETGAVYITQIAGKGEVLNEASQSFFDTGIPDLSSERPDVFQVPISGYEPGTEDYDPLLQEAIDASTLEDKLGTRVYNDLEGLGNNTATSGMRPEQIGLIITALIFFAVGGIGVHPAFGAAGLALAIPVGIASMEVGFIAVVYIAFAIAACAVILIWNKVAERT